jgi:hypothetical protein
MRDKQEMFRKGESQSLRIGNVTNLAHPRKSER